MRRAAAGLLLLVASITDASGGADPPLPAPPAPAPTPMPTADGVDASLIGAGAIREVRVVEGDDGRYQVSLATAGGWWHHPLDADAGNGTWYTLEGLRLVDVTGDPEPELRLEYASQRDPCGCDDGPTFSSHFVVVCTVARNGPRCSAPIEVAMRNHAIELDAFDAELVISRTGVARLRVIDSEGLTRRERAALARPFRLFR
jgi:hypothetical protein